jgi:hypothetical protein
VLKPDHWAWRPQEGPQQALVARLRSFAVKRSWRRPIVSISAAKSSSCPRELALPMTVRRVLVPSSARSPELPLDLTQHHRFGAFRMRIAPISRCIEPATASEPPKEPFRINPAKTDIYSAAKCSRSIGPGDKVVGR